MSQPEPCLRPDAARKGVCAYVAADGDGACGERCDLRHPPDSSPTPHPETFQTLLRTIRGRLEQGYVLSAPAGLHDAVRDVESLLAEVDRQAAEIERLRNLADALAFPEEESQA